MLYFLHLVFNNLQMNTFKKVLLYFALFFVLIAVSSYGYLIYTKPNYDGKISLKNISACLTTLNRDAAALQAKLAAKAAAQASGGQ